MKKLTDVWKDGGITEQKEYAILTNEIYKEWSGMTAKKYKEYKGLRKDSLRDNIIDLEVVLTDLGEITTRDIASNEHPIGLSENILAAKRGGNVSKVARDAYEKTTLDKAITNKNAYSNDIKRIDN